jgi:membrane dipeptidase
MFDFGLTLEQEARAKELHERSVVIDMETESSFPEGLFDDMQTGGLTCGSFTIGTAGLHHFTSGSIPEHDDWWTYDTTVRDISLWNGIFNNQGNNIVPILSAGDIREANKNGKNGIILYTQNSICIGTDVDNLDFFYNLGLRVIQITYNLQNFMGSGCLEDPKKNLSNFGIQAIGRMNELGILVDTGHTGDGSLKHAIDVSEKPISCSHAGLASQSKDGNPRVQTDSALKKLADNGGVFGLSAIPGMLTGDIRCSINDYLDQLAYVINLMGIDHVGMSSDFIAGATLEQIASAPDWKGEQVPTSMEVWPVCAGHEGFENHSKFMNLTRGLVARDYSDEDITKLIGGNWLRLLSETIR